MITIKNYKLGVGSVFLAWRLDSVTELNDSYVFLWTDRTGHQYQIHLGRMFKNAKGELPMMMFTTTPCTQPLWSGVVNRIVLELHWEWLDKMIWVMNENKPYR
jgi:hypothetical protein